MRKLYPALLVALSTTLLFCVSCDLFYPDAPKEIPRPPVKVAAR